MLCCRNNLLRSSTCLLRTSTSTSTCLLRTSTCLLRTSSSTCLLRTSSSTCLLRTSTSTRLLRTSSCLLPSTQETLRLVRKIEGSPRRALVLRTYLLQLIAVKKESSTQRRALLRQSPFFFAPTRVSVHQKLAPSGSIRCLDGQFRMSTSLTIA
ncbi:hypothetical protein CA13_49960 [Planctomycetes bacterium CA13]|uniref:Uncharacterized protein n=1 Tax=Novipirellula herctigrandis TaxID=2527986 RepID=A0A5C5Z9N7_9BACT|nr:hypothetical protein CA13_49960 [Planctomycetes bacterium CA13]